MKTKWINTARRYVILFDPFGNLSRRRRKIKVCIERQNDQTYNMHSEYAQTCRARFKAKEKEFFEMDFREDDFDQKTFDFVNRIWGKSESTIIELGCGSGSWTKHLANNGNYVIGVDFSFSSVKELKKKVKGSNIETIVADIEYLPFRGRFADQIFLGWVLHHVTNIGRSVNEAARCLRAEGNIVMVEPNGSNFFRMLTHKIGILLSKGMEKRLTSYEEKPLDVPELCKALRQNGLNFGVFPWDAS